MALTPAERAKRHREKLKKDPQKFLEHKKKHAALVKVKSKKIGELNEQEKEKRRQKWREQKRKQKENKQHDTINTASTVTSTSKQKVNKKRKNKQNNLARKYKTALKRIQILTTSLQTTKKKLYRLNIKTFKKIQNLEACVTKMKAREEVLESTIKQAYNNCQTYKEKRVFKSLAENETVKLAKRKTFLTKLLGLKGRIRNRKKRVKNEKIGREIEGFFVRDDISRCTAGKKECRTLCKKKEQIRYLTDTLINLYAIYRSEGGKYSVSTFYKYKPFFVIPPSIQNRNTCLCVKHENFDMLFRALVKNGVLPNCKTVTDVISKVSCNISYQCMHGECHECKKKVPVYNLRDGQTDLPTEWNQWERIDHTYKTNENGASKIMKTKKTAKVIKKGTLATLIQCFESNIPAFKKHFHTWKHQQEKYRECIKGLQDNEALVLCDFSENYICKLAEEIQSMHFGASKHQITLHTGMVYFADEGQSFCTISDNNCHEPAAIWSHLIPVIKMIRENKPGVKVIHFYSDGPSSQYRQKKNFFLLNLFAKKLKLEYSTWSFTESGHGKGVADGIGGAAKRTLDRQVSYGRDVTNGTEAYEVLTKCMPSTKCFYILGSEIDNINKLIPKDLNTLVGTMKIHQIITKTENVIQHRTLSCFCGLNRGLCDCFSPQTHTFNKKKASVTSNDNPVAVAIQKNDTEKRTHQNFPQKCKSKKKEIIVASHENHKIDQVLSNSATSEPSNVMNSIIVDVEVHAPPVIADKLHNDEKPILIIVSDDVDKFDEIIKIDENLNKTSTLSPDIFALHDNDAIPDIKHIIPDVEFIFQIGTDNLVCDEEYLKVVDKISDDPLQIETQPLTDNKVQSLNVVELKLDDSKTSVRKRTSLNNKENHSEPKKIKSSYLPKKNKNPKNFKSLKTIVTRTLECDRCKTKLPLHTNNMVKCMACKKLICSICSDNSTHFDYICDMCYGE